MISTFDGTPILKIQFYYKGKQNDENLVVYGPFNHTTKRQLETRIRSALNRIKEDNDQLQRKYGFIRYNVEIPKHVFDKLVQSDEWTQLVVDNIEMFENEVDISEFLKVRDEIDRRISVKQVIRYSNRLHVKYTVKFTDNGEPFEKTTRWIYYHEKRPVDSLFISPVFNTILSHMNSDLYKKLRSRVDKEKEKSFYIMIPDRVLHEIVESTRKCTAKEYFSKMFPGRTGDKYKRLYGMKKINE